MISLDYTDRVVLITGGGTGIGRAIALAFVEAGANVVVSGRRQQPLETLAAENPDQIAWVTGDVTVLVDAAKMIQATVDRFGRLDILVNNAATAEGTVPLTQASDETIEQLIAVDLTGGLRMARKALEAFPQGGGQIINISSNVVNTTLPGATVYAAAKAGVEQWTRNLAAEVGPMGVRVNAIAPGPTETETANNNVPPGLKEQIVQQTPLRRIGQPEDIARAVRLIASDEASWLTGQVITASGGLWT